MNGISPFEFGNQLVEVAQKHTKGTHRVLDAGRGNPNWIAAAPREAFFSLGLFAVQECRRVWSEHSLAGKPRKEGIAARFETYLHKADSTDGVELLKQITDYGVTHHEFDADEWIYELVDAIVGDNYPTPDKMLVHIEQVVHQFIMQELCRVEPAVGHQPAHGQFDLFAVEGATAAMCYIFDTLFANFLLTPGDKVAIMVPVFPPYLEIPQLSRYKCSIIEIKATSMDQEGAHTWQYPLCQIEKLADRSIKALFTVNPGNPTSVAMQPETITHLQHVVAAYNPNLMIITDDVYCTFVKDYQSLLSVLPFNTIGVYSLSKYFGMTGWRLGVVAVHQQNVFDRLLAQLPHHKRQLLQHRYASLSRHAGQIGFIDRMVADSRQVALNHTAGLSTPQQVQMALCCAFALLDEENSYKQLTMQICARRMRLLYDGLALAVPDLEHSANYYTQFDLDEWAAHHYGQDFMHFLHRNCTLDELLVRLAENSSIVLLPGDAFDAPRWSVRISLANLQDEQYTQIGAELHRILEEYVTNWRNEHADTKS